MKNIYHKLILLLLLPAMTGCRFSFDIEDSGIEPCICVVSYICADSLFNADVYKSVPVHQAGKADMDLVSPSYSLKCNGKEVETVSRDIDTHGIGIASKTFKTGDELELTVSAEGMETVMATTIVPGCFPEHSAETYVDEQGNNCARIHYKDDRHSDDYYAVAVETSTTIQYEDSDPFIITGFAMPQAGHNEISIDPSAYSPVVHQFGDRCLFIWSDEENEDDTYEMKFQTDNYPYTAETAVRFHLYRLSKEMYRYLYAQYDSTYNPFAYMGLSSPSFTYSNVLNGAGCFCAYSVVCSDWMKINMEE